MPPPPPSVSSPPLVVKEESSSLKGKSKAVASSANPFIDHCSLLMKALSPPVSC